MHMMLFVLLLCLTSLESQNPVSRFLESVNLMSPLSELVHSCTIPEIGLCSCEILQLKIGVSIPRLTFRHSGKSILMCHMINWEPYSYEILKHD